MVFEFISSLNFSAFAEGANLLWRCPLEPTITFAGIALRWDDDICDNEVCVGDVGEGEVGGNDVVGKDFDGDGDWQKNFLMTREEMELE